MTANDFLKERGIYPIPLAVPFPVAPVNAILIDGSPLTLIDTGMNWSDSIDKIADAVQAIGKKLEDLEEIWLTHPHLDHCGNAGILSKQSGAKVFSFRGGIQRFEQYPKYWELDRSFYLELLRKSNVPPEIERRERSYRSKYSEMASPVKINLGMENGEKRLLAGRLLAEPLHLPGHSPACLAFWLPEHEILVSGDFLIHRTVSASLIYSERDTPLEWLGISAYRQSLQRALALNPSLVIPGHGSPFREVKTTLQKALQRQLKKANKLLNIIQSNGPSTISELAEQLFGEQFFQNNFFIAFCETYQYLSFLKKSKKLEQIEKNGLLLFKKIDR